MGEHTNHCGIGTVAGAEGPEGGPQTVAATRTVAPNL